MEAINMNIHNICFSKLVETIQMSNYNICFYKENQKKKIE